VLLYLDLNEYQHLRSRMLMKNTFKPLLAAGSLLIALATVAVFSAVQPPVGTTIAEASQSPTATGTQTSNEVPVPATATATAPEVTADAAPSFVPPRAAGNLVPVSAPATATPTATGPTPAASPEDPGRGVTDTNEYVVVAGDTVSAIASRFGVDVNDMLAANGLNTFTLIMPGQTLRLSGPPLEVPAPLGDPAGAPALAPAVRTIYVAGAGGQSMVDSCIGPIHFTPTDGYSVFITEHDRCGGWERFSGIGVGETVTIPGFGTYTATGRGQVPQGSTTNAVAAVFGGFPRAILQTCIPGTNQMLLIALN
jgi:LysM repeat protein